MKYKSHSIKTSIAIIILISISIAACGGGGGGGGSGSIPSGSNQDTINGADGTSSGGIPVKCGGAIGNVHISPNSFSGAKTIKISCVDSGEINDLEQLVKSLTGSTNEVLGAISLEPSPFNFNKSVTLVIPLIAQRADKAGQYLTVYYYAPNVSGDLRQISNALVANDGWTASGSVNHFSTFILVSPSEAEQPREQPAEPTVEVGNQRSLVLLEGNGFAPDMFTSWEIPDTNEFIQFNLDQNVALANGAPFNVNTVMETIKEMDPGLFDEYGFEVIDDFTMMLFPQTEFYDYNDLLRRLSQISFEVR